ncbi:MAG: ParB/RepB/Spo0J family partition protein [Bdellovibrio bacteriovorus]
MSIKGISSLAELMDDLPEAGAQEIELSLIDPDPHQPRTSFDELRLEALAASVDAQGVIEPLIVSAHPEKPGRYMLVAGERRWRAAGMAGLKRVPAVVRELSAEQRLAVQLVENIDREELSVLEESRAVVRLIGFGRKPKEVASMLGKTQAWVSLRRKIADNQELLEVFVTEGLTRDAETLTMLVDLRKVDSAAFDEMHRTERVTRAAVRDALELAKRRKLAPVTPVKTPEALVPTASSEPTIPSAGPDTEPAGGGEVPFGLPGEPPGTPGARPEAILDLPPAAPVREPKAPRSASPRAAHPVHADPEGEGLADRIEAVRRAIQERLAFPVSIHARNPDGSGELRIGFANLQELDLLRKTLT